MSRTAHACRFCSASLERVFVDLGSSPLANSYLEPEALDRAEPFPRSASTSASTAALAQLPADSSPPSRSSRDYAYFSSYSTSWLEHARRYCEAMIERFGLGLPEPGRRGGLERRLSAPPLRRRGVPVLGVEPAANVAAAAAGRASPTEVRFFGRATAEDLAARGFAADLLLGNNVLAHVPDYQRLRGRARRLLKPGGRPHPGVPAPRAAGRANQFDTIYHEHFSYFSFAGGRAGASPRTACALFDVEELPTHGGSLRVYALPRRHAARARVAAVGALLARERAAASDPAVRGLRRARCGRPSAELLGFLIELKRAGRTIVGYGAPAKGNTLLIYCGVRADFLDYTVDRSPHKQGQLPARQPDPHPRARADRRDPPRRTC